MCRNHVAKNTHYLLSLEVDIEVFLSEAPTLLCNTFSIIKNIIGSVHDFLAQVGDVKSFSIFVRMSVLEWIGVPGDYGAAAGHGFLMNAGDIPVDAGAD